MERLKGKLILMISIVLFAVPSIAQGENNYTSYRVNKGDSRTYEVKYCYSNGRFTPKLMLSLMGYFGSKYESLIEIKPGMLFEVTISGISEHHDSWFFSPINYSIKTLSTPSFPYTDKGYFLPFLVPVTQNPVSWSSYGSQIISNPAGLLVDCSEDDWDYYTQAGSISYDYSTGWLNKFHYILSDTGEKTDNYIEYVISAVDNLESFLLRSFPRFSLFLGVIFALWFVRIKYQNHTRKKSFY